MLEKQVIVDLIETVETGCVQVRTATRIIDNGEQLSNTFHRHVIAPGDDYSQEDARVQAICAAVHTPEVIAAYKALITEQQI
jgi:hypothetical protein